MDDEATSVAMRNEVAVRQTRENARSTPPSAIVVVAPKTDRPRGNGVVHQLTADPDRNIGSSVMTPRPGRGWS